MVNDTHLVCLFFIAFACGPMRCNCSVYLSYNCMYCIFVCVYFMLTHLLQSSIMVVFISYLLNDVLHLFDAFNALFQVCKRVIEVV